MSEYKHKVTIEVDALMNDEGHIVVERHERKVDLSQITYVKEWCDDDATFILDKGEVVTTCGVARRILENGK